MYIIPEETFDEQQDHSDNQMFEIPESSPDEIKNNEIT